MQIVVATRIQILSTPFAQPSSTARPPPLYAGQPISANLAITTSLHWGESVAQSHRRFKMRFDVEEIVKDWLVSGRKRGDFFATVCHVSCQVFILAHVLHSIGWGDFQCSNYLDSTASRRGRTAQSDRHSAASNG